MIHNYQEGQHSEAFLNVQSLANEIFPAMTAWSYAHTPDAVSPKIDPATGDGVQELDSIADDIRNLAPCTYASTNAIFVLNNVSLGYSE